MSDFIGARFELKLGNCYLVKPHKLVMTSRCLYGVINYTETEFIFEVLEPKPGFSLPLCWTLIRSVIIVMVNQFIQYFAEVMKLNPSV